MLLSAARQAWAYQGSLANLTPVTLEGREERIGRFVTWCSAHDVTEVEAVTVPLIHQFLHELPPHLADSTRNTYARVVRAFMNYCAAEDLVPERLPRRIQIPKVPIKVIEVFTTDHIKRLLAACGREPEPTLVARDKAVLSVLLDTGLRATELCELTLAGVHFTTTDTWLEVMGKGRRERQVGPGERARIELHRWLYRYRQAPAAEQHMFLTRKGPLTRSGLLQLFARLEEVAGPEHFTGVRVSPHTCRHIMAVNYLAQGEDAADQGRLLPQRGPSTAVEQEPPGEGIRLVRVGATLVQPARRIRHGGAGPIEQQQ